MLARLAAVALALGTTPLMAQHHDDSAGDLAGTWEGTFKSEAVGTGGMKLVIMKEKEWKGVITISRDESMTAEATMFTVDGNEITWVLNLHESPCQTTATREGSVIRGETNCGHAGFTFELKKVK